MPEKTYTLSKVLQSDLNRQRFFQGQSAIEASNFMLFKSALNPRFAPVVICRLANWCFLKKMQPLAKLISLFNFVCFGIEIAIRCEIDEGLYFPHTVGTVIGARRIGKNAVIYHGVTFGAKEIDIGYHDDQRPIVGDNVIVGSGAKVLGGITIGDNVVIGANAVVVESVPSNVVVGGIPAKIIRQR